MYLEMDCPCKGKNLDKMLQPGILLSLQKGEKYGSVLIKDLKKNPMFVGQAPDKTGVYRYMKRMEASGYLLSEWVQKDTNEMPRRVYRITDKGRVCLMNWKVTLRTYTNSMKELMEEIDKAIEI